MTYDERNREASGEAIAPESGVAEDRSSPELWLAGEGEMISRMRAFDWSTTPVGPVETWPASLKNTVATVLHSRHPMFLCWGSELTQVYNDAYVPSFGVGKHPAALGQPGRDCWPEIWAIIGPQIEAVMSRGTALGECEVFPEQLVTRRRLRLPHTHATKIAVLP